MKKKITVALCLICAIVCGVIVSGVTSRASSANISISTDSQTVKKEQEFSVKVTVSSDAAMQNIDTMLGYDPQVLEYVKSDSSAVAGASGMIHIMEEFLDPVTSVTYTLTFKALELGSSSLSVSDTYISEAETFNIVPVSSDSVNVEVITNKQESSETRLSELLIAPGEMNEEFNPDVYEYTVEAAYEDENVAISAIPMDENSVVTMEKSDTLSFGENKVIITVTAPSGNTSTYTVTVNRPAVPEETMETGESDTTETSESDTMETSESGTTGTSESDTMETESGEAQSMEAQVNESEAVLESQVPGEAETESQSGAQQSSEADAYNGAQAYNAVDENGNVIVPDTESGNTAPAALQTQE